MPKSKQAKGISWKTVFGILGSIAVLVGSIVSGLDFINYLREGYQQFLWLGIAVSGVIWLIVLWLLFKQRNIYWMLYLTVTILAGVVIWNGWHSYILAREDKLVVLIAKFDGPEEVYGLQNEILEKLNQDFANDAEVEIDSVNEVITPDSDSSSPRAKKLGENLQADIVIWGWYRPTENPNITIHVENLAQNELETIKESETYKPQVTLADLESFEIQRRLGSETSTLVSFLTGFLRYKAGDFQVAIERFQQVLNEKDVYPFLNRADVHFFIGTAHAWIGEYEKSIRDFDDSVNLEPNFAMSYYNRGVSYVSLNEYDKALTDFNKTIELLPSYSSAYNNRGFVYLQLGQYEIALEDFNNAINIDPEFVLCFANRGQLYSQTGQYDLALRDLNRAIKLDSPLCCRLCQSRLIIFSLGTE